MEPFFMIIRVRTEIKPLSFMEEEKLTFSIPPCDGSANLGRRGYAIWAPQGIVENYSNPSKQTTQEWEMSNDLGDRHNYSLMQGGALPDNSLECRVVGRVFQKPNP